MSLRSIGLCAALLLGLSAFGVAQSDNMPAPPAYPNQGYYGNQGYPVCPPSWAMYRNAYVAGYQAGFNGGYAQTPYVGPQGAPVYQGPVYGQPVYGQAPYVPPAYANNPAYQRGFQDGLNDGQQDRQTNHEFRPMATHNYDHTPGYDSSFGEKEQYKQIYRNAYVAGYQQGFGWTGAYVQPPYAIYAGGYPVATQPPYVNQQAYQMGYQDGVTDGRDDRESGKAFWATSTEKYEDAPGYNKSLGQKSVQGDLSPGLHGRVSGRVQRTGAVGGAEVKGAPAGAPFFYRREVCWQVLPSRRRMLASSARSCASAGNNARQAWNQCGNAGNAGLWPAGRAVRVVFITIARNV